MEKYCPKCHKTYENLKAKFCTNCATELITREKRKPIPRELRHKIFVRDGYRCRECGKSKDETSLEIDHIYPLSKGGTTTEDNLWTLCRDCNQDKRDDVWQDNEIELTRNELANLENQLREAEDRLKNATNEDDIRDYKFKIKKFNTEYIPEVKNKLNKLNQKEKIIESERRKRKEENKRRERLFKDLYIELEGKFLLDVCEHFSLKEQSNDDNLRLLVDKHSENEIRDFVTEYRKTHLFKKLKSNFDKKCLTEVFTHFSLKEQSDDDNLRLLVDKHSENEIYKCITEIKEEKRRKLEKEKKERIKENCSFLTNEQIKSLANKYSIPPHKTDVINYFTANFSEVQIYKILLELSEEKFLDKLKETKSSIKASEKSDIPYDLVVKWYNYGKNGDSNFVNFYNKVNNILADLIPVVPEIVPH